MSVSANHTKSGPGRKHQHCLLRTLDGKAYFKRPPQKRLASSTGVGNWKGKEYLSYGEHDGRVTARLNEVSA